MARKHLIIGAGPAGLTALETIRRLNREDEVILVSRERCLPYSPTALPYLISGQIDESKLWIADETHFKRMACNFIAGREVTRVTPQEKRIFYKNGEKETYDTLLISTGSSPQRPQIQGIENVGYLSFHTLEDYHELVRRLEQKKEVLIYGGGLVTMGLASGLTKRGFKVKIIVRSRILRSYFDPYGGEMIAEDFLSRGAEIITGKEIRQVKKTGSRVEAELMDGNRFSGDLLVCCLGTIPRVSFLKSSGIEVNKGICVNHKMETNIKDIYAAGDVAEAPDFFGKPGLNAVVPNAVAQGEVAGANMAGDQKEFEGWIPMNVFNFFDSSACSIGECQPEGDDKEILEREILDKSFKRLVFKDDRLIGAVFVNEVVDPGVIRYLIEKKVNITAYKDLLFEKTRDASRWLKMKEEKQQTGLLEN